MKMMEMGEKHRKEKKGKKKKNSLVTLPSKKWRPTFSGIRGD